MQTIQKQLEENHLLIDSLTETIQTLENDNLSQLEIYKQQQEEANIEQSKLLKEKETILKQKEELISNKDILLRQKDTQLQSILEKMEIRATYSSFNKRERRIGKTKKCTKPRTGCKCKGAKTTEPGLGVTAASARRTIAKRTRGSR